MSVYRDAINRVFYTTTPHFVHPMQAAPAFSSSLGRVKASFPLHSLFRQFFKRRGKFPFLFLPLFKFPQQKPSSIPILIVNLPPV